MGKNARDSIGEPDNEWFMIDTSYCKVYPHVVGAKGGNQGMNHIRGGSRQNLLCRGFIWHAGQNPYYRRHRG